MKSFEALGSVLNIRFVADQYQYHTAISEHINRECKKGLTFSMRNRQDSLISRGPR